MKSLLLKSYYVILKIKDSVTSVYNKVIRLIISPPLVKSADETLDKLINNNCSISRYGDGEFALMYGKDLLFQPYYPKLALRLREIIKSRKNKHIVGIPNVFMGVDWYTEQAEKYWKTYLSLNLNKIYRTIDMKKRYYDSLVTRLYIDYKDKSKSEERFSKFKKLWDKRDIVIVEGERSRLGLGNNLFDNVNSINRIICPAKNAFAKYEVIFNAVIKQDKSKLILIALGPTATVLAYDLSIEGYQAIDIGHIDIEYEWFLQKAVEKGPVKNKYIGEIPNGTDVDDISDFKYESEIITKIVM
jgi:glycosyltransferase family protein